MIALIGFVSHQSPCVYIIATVDLKHQLFYSGDDVIVSAILNCQPFHTVSHFVLSAILYCQPFYTVSHFILSAILYCQPFYTVSHFILPSPLQHIERIIKEQAEKYEAGKKPENVKKNRFPEILPGKKLFAGWFDSNPQATGPVGG